MFYQNLDLFVCLSIYLSIYPSIYLAIYLSIYLPIYHLYIYTIYLQPQDPKNTLAKMASQEQSEGNPRFSG